MTTHELKTDQEVFDAVWDETKNFEIRFNDRDFQVGDFIKLEETVEHEGNGDPNAVVYTGRSILVEVDYILHGPVYGLKEDWVIMSFMIISFHTGRA